jgi:hypothetical protein
MSVVVPFEDFLQHTKINYFSIVFFIEYFGNFFFKIKVFLAFFPLKIRGKIHSQSVLHMKTMVISIDQDNKCACLQEVDSVGSPVNARMCNITCREKVYCGGEDHVNVYNVGKSICFQVMYTFHRGSTSNQNKLLNEIFFLFCQLLWDVVR